MATRSCIARPHLPYRPGINSPIAFTGVYHHWDGSPGSLGQELVKIYYGHFNRDMNAMRNLLLDHAWSTIHNANWDAAPGFVDDPYMKVDGHFMRKPDLGPLCYCHGERSERVDEVTHENAGDFDAEYAYVLCTKEEGNRQNAICVLDVITKDRIAHIGTVWLRDEPFAAQAAMDRIARS